MMLFVVTTSIIEITTISSVLAQSSNENSNLTNPNDPTLTMSEMSNTTSLQGNNSNESENNLPAPM